MILEEARESAKAAGDRGDEATNDLLISDVVRTNEMQVWFASELLAGAGLKENAAALVGAGHTE